MAKGSGGSGGGRGKRTDFAGITARARANASQGVRRSGSVSGYLRAPNRSDNYNRRTIVEPRITQRVRNVRGDANTSRVQRSAASRRTRRRQLRSGQMTMFDF